MRFSMTVLGIVLIGFALEAAQTTDPEAPLIPHPVSTNILGGEQLLAVDMNKDGKQDLIALGRQMGQLVWFESPYWTRRSLIHGMGGMTSMAANDPDNDGVPQ